MMIYTRNIYGKENLRRVFNLNHFREIRIITDGRDEIAETIGAKNIPDNFTFLSAYGDSGFSILDVNRIEFLNGLLDDFMQAVFNGDKVYDINNYYMRAESKAGLAGKSSLESWLEEQLIKNENVRLDVLKFIWNFITLDKNPESFRVIEHQFTMGYCYHFALIMKKMFGGRIVWHKGHSHILWQDRNKVVYDIRGVYCDYNRGEIVPVSALGDEIEDYFHRW